MVHKHIEGIVEYPRLMKESHESLRKLIDAMHALTAIKQPVKEWHCLLIYLISSKSLYPPKTNGRRKY